jgi:ceramide glucosyltransferase
MSALPSYVLLACAATAAVVYCLGIVSAWLHLKGVSEAPTKQPLPPITLLKPIKGLEECLESNLRSIFEQDYPSPVQIVFASTEASDPGIDVARRVADDHPDADVAFVRSDPDFGLNPKVANLQGALNAARHDRVLQTDANVRLRPDTLKRIVEEFEGTGASLLGCLVVGVGERSAAAALENLQLTAYIAPAMCAALRFGNTTCVVGKAIAFRRSELDGLGGLSLVKDVLLEDFVLGRAYRRAGKKVVLSPLTVENVNVRTSLRRFAGRHSRWLKMTAVTSAPGFVGQFFANPVPFFFLAAAAAGFEVVHSASLALLVVLKTVTDAATVRRLRGEPMALRYRWLSPARDFLALGMWFHALFSRTTEWRGIRFRIGEDTRITVLSTDRDGLGSVTGATPEPVPDANDGEASGNTAPVAAVTDARS